MVERRWSRFMVKISERSKGALRMGIAGLVLAMSLTLLVHLTAGSPAPSIDRAYLQSIWNGWSTLDASHQSQFYAQGSNVYFDEAPLKYDSWGAYEEGAAKILKTIKSAKFTINNDLKIHPAGNIVWATATVDQDATLTDGKRDVTTFRWTVIFARENNKWLIVHEHVSRPTE